MFRTILLLLGVFWRHGLAAGPGAPLMSVDAADPREIRVKVSPRNSLTTGLLEVIDAKTGECAKTLFAGSFFRDQAFSLNLAGKLPQGDYRLRCREEISLTPEGSLPPGENRRWTNPTDLVLTDKAIYVLDSGEAPPDENPRAKTKPSSPGNTNAGRAFIYKFHRDGRPDASFGERGRIGPLLGPGWDKLRQWNYYRIRSLAVDPDGKIYISSIYHESLIFDANGKPMSQTIGGWDNDPYGPKCTTWVNSLALGPRNRIYLPSSYSVLRVYDRTKDKFDGLLYSAKLPEGIGLDRVIASDGKGTFFIINRTGRIQKFKDTGRSVIPLYHSSPDIPMMNLTGPSACCDLIWAAAHGGPPLWDLDAGEVDLFWDNGREIALVERYGLPGAAANKLQFLNPSAAIQTPDHLELWVVEDGVINDEGLPGNARIRKFRIACARSEEFPFKITRF